MPSTDSASRVLISDLHSSGYSYNKIGKMLGRDSSLIQQIAKGKKPGRNLEAALRGLKESGLVEVQPARRLRKSGEAAAVRRPGSVKAQKAAAAPIPGIVDAKGRVINAELDGLSKSDVAKILREIRKHDGVISFTATALKYKKYRQLQPGTVEVQIFEDGIDAREFHLGDGIESALITELLENQDVSAVGGLVNIQLNAVY